MRQTHRENLGVAGGVSGWLSGLRTQHCQTIAVVQVAAAEQGPSLALGNSAYCRHSQKKKSCWRIPVAPGPTLPAFPEASYLLTWESRDSPVLPHHLPKASSPTVKKKKEKKNLSGLG